MLAVTQEPVEQDTDGEQVGGDVPALQAGVGRLVRRRARAGVNGVADPRGDVEVKQLRAGAGEHHVERLDVAVDQPLVLQLHPLARLGFRQVAFAAFRVQLLEARRVGVESDERVEQIKCDIYCFPVAQAPVPGDKLIE